MNGKHYSALLSPFHKKLIGNEVAVLPIHKILLATDYYSVNSVADISQRDELEQKNYVNGQWTLTCNYNYSPLFWFRLGRLVNSLQLQCTTFTTDKNIIGSPRNIGESITVFMGTNFTKNQLFLVKFITGTSWSAIIEAVLSNSDWLVEVDH